MTDLSPAARAVLTAQAKERCLFEWSHVNDPPCHPSDPEWNGCFDCIDRRGIAATLRAAADQLQKRKPRPSIGIDWSSSELYAIAAELEDL